MKTIPIFSSKKAIRNHNKILLGLQDLENRMIKPQETQTIQEPQITLDDHIRQQGVPSTFSVKRNLAKNLGMDYMGTPEHDNSLLMAMQGIGASRGQIEQSENENKFKDREMGLKEKELELKSKDFENRKYPTGDEIADSILNKINQQ